MKKYLLPGQSFDMAGGEAVIGVSASIADISVQWLSIEKGENGTIGEFICSERLSYNVHIDKDNGRLWYDDETGI